MRGPELLGGVELHLLLPWLSFDFLYSAGGCQKVSLAMLRRPDVHTLGLLAPKEMSGSMTTYAEYA